MRTLSTVLFLIVGFVNLLPILGALSASRLQALYGLVFEDANLLILMRHRAILFGIVGGLVIISAFHAPLRPIGVGVGLVSMLSFVLIAYSIGDYNAELRRVVLIDLVASALLIAAGLTSRLASAA